MAPSPRSLKVDRHKRILALVNARKRVSLADLEAALRSPRITVQRDLVELENLGLLRRFHGGVMSKDFSGDLYNYDQKKSVQVEAKKKIAAKANRLLREGAVVGLDSSSTVYYLSETLFPAGMTVLACGIDSFKNLSSRDDLQAILAGGRLSRATSTLYGNEMTATIRKFRFDIAFVSAESFIPGCGFFDPHAEDVAVKRALIESSERTAMLLDGTKIASASGIRVCENEEVDWVITDEPANKQLRGLFGEKIL